MHERPRDDARDSTRYCDLANHSQVTQKTSANQREVVHLGSQIAAYYSSPAGETTPYGSISKSSNGQSLLSYGNALL
jgi:hypothetical protein